MLNALKKGAAAALLKGNQGAVKSSMDAAAILNVHLPSGISRSQKNVLNAGQSFLSKKQLKDKALFTPAWKRDAGIRKNRQHYEIWRL